MLLYIMLARAIIILIITGLKENEHVSGITHANTHAHTHTHTSKGIILIEITATLKKI